MGIGRNDSSIVRPTTQGMNKSTVSPAAVLPISRPPLLARSIALMKPVTWFPPLWAFLCGAVASNAAGWNINDIGHVMLGIFLTGPIVCGLSQVINDYCDREVDAINEPNRPIPSGMVSTTQVFVTAIVLLIIAGGIAWYLGPMVFNLTAVGVFLAMIYSAHPIRAKRNGWIGNALVAASYEGLPWLAGHLVFAPLTPLSIIVAILYSVGAHGIMTVNDFKSIEGDKRVGIKTIPVLYGVEMGAWLAVLTMNIAQLFVLMTLFVSGRTWAAVVLLVLIVAQLPVQRTFIKEPREKAVFYNATGIMLYVWGMLVTAIGL